MARPKKSNVRRDAAGKSRGEPIMDIIGTALAHRLRDVSFEAAVVRNERDQIVGANYLCGFTLGVLRCQNRISIEQYEAGEKYARMIHRNARIMGLRVPVLLAPTGPGRECAPDPKDGDVADARDDFRAAREKLLRAGAVRGVGSRVNAITYRVCIENPHVSTLSAREVEWLGYGLNALR